jgi:hypothetical protein
MKIPETRSRIGYQERKTSLAWLGQMIMMSLFLLLSGCCEDETEPIQTYGYGPVDTIVALPDGKRFVSGVGGGPFVWDIRTGTVIRRFVKGSIDVVAVSSDGRRVVTGGLGYAEDLNDGPPVPRKFWLWDTETGDLLRTLGERICAEWWMTATFSPDGARALVAGNYNREVRPLGVARLYDVTTGQLRWTLEPSHTFAAVAFSPDGAQVLAGGPPLRRWDVETGELLGQYVSSGCAIDTHHVVTFSPDARFVAASAQCYGDYADLWDATAGRSLGCFRGGNAVAFSFHEPAQGSAGRAATGGRLAAQNAPPRSDRFKVSMRDPIIVGAPHGSALLTGNDGGPAQLFDVCDVLGRLRIQPTSSGAELTWDSGVLQSAHRIEGPWADVPNARSPHPIAPQVRMKL